jgi:hypothetical protein
MFFVKSLTQQSTFKFTTFLFNFITYTCRLHHTLAAVTLIQYMTLGERSTALNNPKQLKSALRICDTEQEKDYFFTLQSNTSTKKLYCLETQDAGLF